MTKRLGVITVPTLLMLLPCTGEAKEKPPIVSSALSIDFGAEETAGPVQAGYVEWAGPYVGNPGLNYNETRSFGADFGVGGVVNLTVQSDGLFFRDYEPIIGGAFVDQSALLSDSILRNQPGSIFLTFNSLTDGVYSMTSFHHDTRFGSPFVPFDIILTDSLVTDQALLSGLDTTGGTSPSAVLVTHYRFTVVGGSPVTVEFAGHAQLAQHMSINGFQLQRISDVSKTNDSRQVCGTYTVGFPPGAPFTPVQRSRNVCDVEMGFQFLLDGDLKGPVDLLVSISLKGPCDGDWSQPANVHGRGLFVGTLGEPGGSLDVTMSAKHEQDYVAHGQFVIQHAAGDLAGLHGILNFAGSVGGGGTYCGEVHFAP